MLAGTQSMLAYFLVSGSLEDSAYFWEQLIGALPVSLQQVAHARNFSRLSTGGDPL